MWIECFKAGLQTDSSGQSKNWTVDDLDSIVQNYNSLNPDGRDFAPVVVGHPATESIAYGWVSSLKRVGDTLWADLSDLSPEFINWVNAKLYTNRSIALNQDLTLRHVGFLGAVPPAVKGLAPVKFNAKELKKNLVFEFADTQPPSLTNENVTPNSQVTASEPVTVDSILAAQKIREELFGIGVKSQFGYLQKPTAYKDLEDADFADPTNYLFPINNYGNLIASWKLFEELEMRQAYNQVERQLILSRIITQARVLQIPIFSDKISIFKEINKSKNYSIGQQMDDTLYSQLMAEITKFIADMFGQEPAVQTQAKFEELREKYATLEKAIDATETQTTTATTTPVTSPQPTLPVPVSPFSTSKEIIELKQQIANMQRENLMKDLQLYCDSQIREGQIVPAQKKIVLAALDMTSQINSYQFSDNNNKTYNAKGTEMIKSLIESFPKQIEFSDVAKKREPEADLEFIKKVMLGV